MPSVVRIAELELRALLRMVGPPAAGAVGFGVLALVLQEPSFARGPSGVPWLATSTEALLVGLTALVPLAWADTRVPESPGFAVGSLGASLAILGFALVAAAVTTGTLIALNRITLPAAVATAARVLFVAAPLAALAPALAAFAGRAGRAFAWLAVLVGSFGHGIPIPLDRLLGDPTVGLPGWPLVACSVASTAAGLAWSLAAIRWVKRT